jgi:hypothetical protein
MEKLRFFLILPIIILACIFFTACDINDIKFMFTRTASKSEIITNAQDDDTDLQEMEETAENNDIEGQQPQEILEKKILGEEIIADSDDCSTQEEGSGGEIITQEEPQQEDIVSGGQEQIQDDTEAESQLNNENAGDIQET